MFPRMVPSGIAVMDGTDPNDKDVRMHVVTPLFYLYVPAPFPASIVHLPLL